MKMFALCTALAMLCLSFSCSSSNNEKTKELEQQIAGKNQKIDELDKAIAGKNKQIADLQEHLENVSKVGNSGKVAVKWSKILEDAKKMRDEDGKYACFYVVLLANDAASVTAATQELTDKGYKVEPSPWAGILRVSSPQKAREEWVVVDKVMLVKNTKVLNDDCKAEIGKMRGVKSVWPQSILFFPAAIGKSNPGINLFIDVKVIALPPEFFEAEQARLDLKEFVRYDGGGAQVIVPRIVVEYFNRFIRFTDGYNLEYERTLTEKGLNEKARFLVVRLASSAFYTFTDAPENTINVKVVGYTDLVKDITIIVDPKVVDDWNKRLFGNGN